MKGKCTAIYAGSFGNVKGDRAQGGQLVLDRLPPVSATPWSR